jgi:hypothetical protein
VAHFRRAANLETEAGLIAMVEPEVGIGPFHLVVRELPPELPHPVTIHTNAQRVRMGPWVLDFDSGQEVWNPRPAWHRLGLVDRQVARLWTIGVTAAQARASTSPFMPLLLGRTVPCVEALQGAFSPFNYRASRFRKAVENIAGRGPGLTPAGDDFLVGMIFGLRVTHHPEASKLASEIHRIAAPRTTWLSRAYLEAAAEGYADEKWHLLLHALSHKDQSALDQAAISAMSFGATSGLDTLSGFLWTLDHALSWKVDRDS